MKWFVVMNESNIEPLSYIICLICIYSIYVDLAIPLFKYHYREVKYGIKKMIVIKLIMIIIGGIYLGLAGGSILIYYRFLYLLSNYFS